MRFWILIALIILPVGLVTPAVARPVQDPPVTKKPDTGEFFERAHGALEDALEMFEKQQNLPASKDLAFYDFLSSTQESQEHKIEGYLEVAAEALGISKINDRRKRVSDMRNQMITSRHNISIYQRKKISAPKSTYNPLVVTKSGYEGKIKYEQGRIDQAEAEIFAEKDKLTRELNKIGMKITKDNIDILLESITGDEFVRISVIFDNAKEFARELEILTEQTGEDLETAKKYYGVYLMLLKTIDNMQNKFIENVDNVYYPKLNEYAQKAKQNISDAKAAITNGGDKRILQNNIDNNQITYEATMLYKQSLAHQKYQMARANKHTKRNILTAVNTYKTVALSKDLAALMSVSRRAFESIANLSVPDLRPFQNSRMKSEFSKLTRDLKNK